MKIIKMFLVLLCLVGSVFGTNYYFADGAHGGSSGNTGLTPASPKASYTAIPGTLNPGDSILTKCGSQMFISNIVVPSSGTAQSPIVIASYGTGTKPIINAGYYINNWILLSGNIYAARQTSDPEGVLNAGDTCIRNRDSTLAQLQGDNVVGAWYWDDPKDTLYMVANSLPSNNTVLIKYSAECILINGKSNIIIQDMDLRGIGTTYGGILAMSVGSAITGILIQRCDFPYFNNEAIYLYNTQGAIVRDCNIKNSWNGAPYNHTYKTPKGCGISITNSYSNANLIYRNKINNCYQGIYTESGTLNDSIYLNIITNSLVNGVNFSNDAKSNPTKFFNNVVVHNPYFTSGHGFVVQGSGKGGAIVKNNIITCPYIGTNTNVQCISLINDVNTIVNNNCYYLPPGSTGAIGSYGGMQFSLADWQTAIAGSSIKGKDSLSISINPQLDSLYKISGTNQCAKGGVSVGLTQDYYGNAIPNAGYPIGINSPNPAPPTLSNLSVTSGRANSKVKWIGTNLNFVDSVKINNIKLTIDSTKADTCYTFIPLGTPRGYYTNDSLFTTSGKVKYSGQFRVLAPSITVHEVP